MRLLLKGLDELIGGLIYLKVRGIYTVVNVRVG